MGDHSHTGIRKTHAFRNLVKYFSFYKNETKNKCKHNLNERLINIAQCVKCTTL